MNTTTICISLLFSFSAFAGFNVGSEAPTIQLPTLNQGIESITTINQGSKPGQTVVLEFFGTGCSFCLENMKNIREFSKEFSEKAVFRLIGIDRQESLTRDFAAANPDFNVVVDAVRAAKKAYEVQAAPTTFVIGADNKVLFIGLGPWSEVEKARIRELINQ